MADEIILSEKLSKEQIYLELIPQVKSLVANEPDLIANLANISSALQQAFNFFWVGFYLVKDAELVLGPFQGPVACTRIGYNKGVCGKAWAEKKAIIVRDVSQFPGHIECNSASKSEIVIPVIRDDSVTMVLDVDSDELDDFNETDRFYLEKLLQECFPD